MKLAWATDVHLNFVESAARQEFYRDVRESRSGALLLGGDIGEAATVRSFLHEMAGALDVPMFFVLGNHDYYGGSIQGVQAQMAGLPGELVWLPAAGVVQLAEHIALIGHGGWADGRLGDFFGSRVLLNDYVQIAELSACRLDRQCLYERLNQLGDEAAAFIEQHLPEACRSASEVVLLTHVPPFRDACWHEGKLPNGDWLPHFTCKAMGDAILRVMAEFPSRRLLVLCGHTHGQGESRLADNIVVKTGGAVYGSPAINEILELEASSV